MSRIWEGHKLVACLGTGGVGKTTVSATIAVAAAHHGLKTLVMTIDPARRLADALGLKDIGNTERQVEPELFEPYGFELKAPLWVMMPDVKQTFDGVISRLHSSPDAQNNILNNRFYTQLSTAIAGAQEYAAVEKLYEVVQSGQYDLIVLDTPPSQNAIDFLDAPGKMIDFLEHESLQWLIKPYSVAGKLSLRMLDVSGNLLHRTLGKLAGGETLRELAEFLIALSSMFEGFRERYHEVRELLRSDTTAFTLVTSPHQNQRAAMLRFHHELSESGYRAKAVVINRLHSTGYSLEDVPTIVEALQTEMTPAELGPLEAALRAEAHQAWLDHEAAKKIREALATIPLIMLPELPLDAHDLGSLIGLHEAFAQMEQSSS